MSNIQIVVDNLDDIFDDFDPRRITLSRDFVRELKSRYLENPSAKGIVIIMPKEFKNRTKSKEIIYKIKSHFKKQEIKKYKTITSIRKQGVFYVALGILVLTAVILVLQFLKLTRLGENLLELIYPLGWFGMWEGLSKIVDFPKELRDDEETYYALGEIAYKFSYKMETVNE